jgi:SpoVK/Ycf46/Vps4 family AAA+-type ATPase
VEKTTKELIKALVEVLITLERMEDIIEGNGNRLIMLLLGSPGTGKTFTAGKGVGFQRCSIDSIEGSALNIH